MIFPLFSWKIDPFREKYAYFIKYAFLYTSIDIIKELHLIYNISNTKYEENSNFWHGYDFFTAFSILHSYSQSKRKQGNPIWRYYLMISYEEQPFWLSSYFHKLYNETAAGNCT